MEDGEDQVTLRFRLADLYGPTEESRRLLHETIRRYAGTRFEEFARRRLELLELSGLKPQMRD